MSCERPTPENEAVVLKRNAEQAPRHRGRRLFAAGVLALNTLLNAAPRQINAQELEDSVSDLTATSESVEGDTAFLSLGYEKQAVLIENRGLLKETLASARGPDEALMQLSGAAVEVHGAYFLLGEHDDLVPLADVLYEYAEAAYANTDAGVQDGTNLGGDVRFVAITALGTTIESVLKGSVTIHRQKLASYYASMEELPVNAVSGDANTPATVKVYSLDGNPAHELQEHSTVPIVFIPGMNSTGATYAQLAVAFASEGRPVTVLEVPQDIRSQKSAGELQEDLELVQGYTVATSVAVKYAKEHFTSDSVDCYAYSFGNIALVAHMQESPDACRSLTLINPPIYEESLFDYAETATLLHAGMLNIQDDSSYLETNPHMQGLYTQERATLTRDTQHVSGLGKAQLGLEYANNIAGADLAEHVTTLVNTHPDIPITVIAARNDVFFPSNEVRSALGGAPGTISHKETYGIHSNLKYDPTIMNVLRTHAQEQ